MIETAHAPTPSPPLEGRWPGEATVGHSSTRVNSSSPPPPKPALGPEAAARFRALVDANFSLVWRFLRGLGVPPQDADDAAQQVFWVAAQRLDRIHLGSERAFLLATARGTAANARRAHSRVREIADDDALAERVDAAANPEHSASLTQARVLLDRFLDSLSEDVRSVFVLFELEGMTMAAIAELLETPPGTVASRLRRGREDFQAVVKRFQAQRGGQT
jgi:RNA polymerase sigma-70 factor (ECF subfamily)